MSPTKKPSAVGGLRRGVDTRSADPLVHSGGATDPVGGDLHQPDAPAQMLPRPEKPVRFTLDLDRERHGFLKIYATQTGIKVGASDVLRALLDELRDDPDLSARVRARIRAAKTSGR